MGEENKFKFFDESSENKASTPTPEHAQSSGNNDFTFIENVYEPTEDRTTAPGVVPAAFAVAGAGLKYKGWDTKLLHPAPGLFAPDRTPVNPGYANPIHPVNAPSGGIPDDLKDIEHMLQSGQDKRSSVTGRQMESGHNWETQRQSLATKGGLKTPGAAERIVEAGPQVATKSGISIPKHVAVKIAEEEKMAQARQIVAAQKAEQEAAKAAARRGLAKGAAKVGLGALGGAISAKELYEGVAEAVQRCDIDARTAAKILSGAGGVAMMVPTPATVIGGALAQVPALGYAAYDYLKGE